MKIEFDIFWEAYEKKCGLKRKLKIKWDRLSESDQEKALKHIPLYVESQPDKQYRKNPETYLNNESWNDEIICTNTKQNIKNTARLTYAEVLNLHLGVFPIPADKDIWDKLDQVKENDKVYWVYK